MVVKVPFFAALLLAGVVLAGCSGRAPPADDGPALPALPARELPWSMQGCTFVAAVLQVPVSVVAPFVPPGFRVMHAAEFALEGASGQGLPTPPTGGDDGNIGVEAFQCADGAGLDGEVVPGLTYASFYTGVEPPAELRRDTPFHFVKWDVLIPDQARNQLLASYGVPVHNGTATASLGLIGQQSLAQVTASTDFGFGPFTFDAKALAPFPDDRCGFVEFTPVPTGFVEWTMACHFVTGGVGPLTVDVPVGSWFADAIGAGSHDGLGFIGVVDFAQGSIKLPAVAAA